jgi:hypothetical protein
MLPYFSLLEASSVQTSNKGNYGNFGSDTSEISVASRNSVISEILKISVRSKISENTFR